MKRYLLDKIIDVDTTYTAEMDKAYVIQAVGTDSSTKATLKVAGAPVLEIVEDIAPIAPKMTNLNGLLELGDLYVVVPPSKKFSFTGASGSKMRIKGYILELGPGEALPAGLLARYTEQSKKFISYLSGSQTTSEGNTVSAGTETTVIEQTIGAGEKWVFNHRYQAEGRLDDLTNVSRFYSRIYLNDDPFDILDTDMGNKGIAGQAAPNPPRDVTTTTTDIEAQEVEKKAFSLKDNPIEAGPGDIIKVTMLNNGSDYTVPTGKTLYQIVHIVGVKEYI